MGVNKHKGRNTMRTTIHPLTSSLAADDVLIIPGYGIVNSRQDVTVDAEIYSAPMDRVTGYELAKEMLKHGGHPVLCRNIPEEEWLTAVQELYEHPNFWIAVDGKLEMLEKLEKLGLCLNVAIDIAHGHSVQGVEAILKAKQSLNVHKIMSGSIATGDAAAACIEAGATHLRVGIGPGSACTTRLMTGCGIPQLTAVAIVAEVAKEYDTTVIADGGIKYPGDAAKYLVAGAHGFMMGNVFSKAIEAPGWIQDGWEPLPDDTVVKFPLPEPTPIMKKHFRGHASADFQSEHFGTPNRCPEGASLPMFQWDGSTVIQILELYRGGLASACSYAGVTRSSELYRAQFIHNTTAAQQEAKPRG